jgi:hypothetical protein
MIIQLIATASTALISFIILQYFYRKTGKAVSASRDGLYILRMPAAYRYLGVVSILLGFFIFLFPVFDESFMASDLLVAGSLGSMFILAGLICVLYYNNHYLQFDNEAVEVRNIWGTVRYFRWPEMRDASFNVHTGLLSFSVDSGKRLKIHQHLVGLKVFTDMIEQKTLIIIDNTGLPVYRK